MLEAQPSRTALRVALRRAAHQVHDAEPRVLDDALAVRILPPDARAELARTPNSKRRPHSAALRAFMVARSRFAEDVLRTSVAQGIARQYLLLGAGLDTFAYRQSFADVKVFEVDHAATQAWKRECLERAAIAVPANAHLVSVDFEHDVLAARLRDAGFRFDLPTVVAWLGVVPYLTLEGFRTTLAAMAPCAPGSELVFDYSYPRASLPPVEQLMLDSMSARVAQAGEPFRLFFTVEELSAELERAGLHLVENLGSHELNARYFHERTDGLHLRGRAGHLCHAAWRSI